MAGLPSMVFASLAIALSVASCDGFPGPAPGPAAPRVGAPAAAAPDLATSGPGAPQSKAEARDLQASETYGLGYYGYGYGYPLAYASYYYPRYSSYVRPYRYYSYRKPYIHWNDYYSYHSYW